jgi:hypothetical protein
LTHPKGKSIAFKSTRSEWLYWKPFQNSLSACRP